MTLLAAVLAPAVMVEKLTLMSPAGTLTQYQALTAALWLDKGYDSRP